MNRQKALETFLNDKVERVALGLYRWRNMYYEVLPYSLTIKRHNWSQFVALEGKYMMREASDQIIKKYYNKYI